MKRKEETVTLTWGGKTGSREKRRSSFQELISL